jgi:hypothetical protein
MEFYQKAGAIAETSAGESLNQGKIERELGRREETTLSLHHSASPA